MIFDFSYDANGTPVSMSYRINATTTPTYYYYGTNSRGDVVALYNSSGSITALYEYDAYGNVTVKSTNGQVNTSESHIANINPIRYRGYVYDTETGFYYLQSRYYDPTTCRFINQDIYYDTGIGLTGLNMFAYCNNNPVNCIDAYGALTVSFSISGNLTFIMGVQFSIGIAFDSHRNIDIQWSYVDFDDDSGTFMIGLWNFGIGASTQILNVDSIYDLYGPAYYFGGSVGEGIGTYAGIDLVVFDEEPKDRVRGVQTTIGWGGGVDVIHMYAPSTKSVLSKNNDSPKNPNFINSAKSAQYYIQKLTVMEKRMGGTV